MEATLWQRNLKFETLQLHVGQESPDRLPMQGQYRFTRHLPMCSATVTMQQQDSDLPMQEIFTEDLQIRQKMYLKEELQHLKAVWQHLQ